MKILKSQSGQMGIKELITIGSAIIVPLVLGWFGQASRTDAKLDLAKAEQVANVLQISQRVTASEVKVENLEKKVDEIRVDVKEILRRIK